VEDIFEKLYVFLLQRTKLAIRNTFNPSELSTYFIYIFPKETKAMSELTKETKKSQKAPTIQR